MIQANDGNLYGTTGNGGEFGGGILFRIALDGLGFQLIHSFQCVTEGCSPGGLIQASDGNLYGINKNGGQFNQGTVFRIAASGSGFQLLHSFQCGRLTGSCLPQDKLIQASDGNLYGVVGHAGFLQHGVYKIAPGGSGFQVLHSFACGNADICSGINGLIQANDGKLYGTTQEGGQFRQGMVFRISPDGTGFTIVQSFGCQASDGCNPFANLVQANDGNLYGTTEGGGSSAQGTVFRIAPNGSGFQLLHSFQCGTDNGCLPRAGLIQASDGNLYGTTFSGGGQGSVFRIAPNGSGFQIIHSLHCETDGCFPQTGLIQASDGNLYGINESGGQFSDGTVFKIMPNGSGFQLLHSFQCGIATDGCSPIGELIQANDGNLYGTTGGGGEFGGGILFRIALDGSSFQLIHSFQCVTGCGPLAGLIQASDGNLYGTTQQTIFTVGLDGSGFQVLHTFAPFFCNDPFDLCRPLTGVIQASDGNLYGTTAKGGESDQGTVFRIALDGSSFTQLHSFRCDGDDGCTPQAGLMEATDGRLYGTTWQGGAFGTGTLYRITLLGVVASPATVPAGGTITATWSGIASPTSTDWIGLYLPEAANSSFIDWIYVSCSKSAGASSAAGSCAFVLPNNLAPGMYALRLFTNNGFTLLATSNSFTVTGSLSLTVSPTTVPAGGTVNATWNKIASPTSTDWIGLYLPEAANSSFIDWIYVSCSNSAGASSTAGSCAFVLPNNLAPGMYALRLFTNNGFTLLATSNSFTVTGSLSLTVSPTTVPAGGTVNATWNKIASPTSTDWICIYRPGAANTSYLAWVYVSCSQSPSSPQASGSCSFPVPAPLPPDTYQLRLLANNGFTSLATSNNFTVTVAP